MAHSTEKPHISTQIQPVGISGGFWPFIPDHVATWSWHQTFSPDECKAIIALAKRQDDYRGMTGGGHSRRKSRVSFLFPNETNNWIFRRMSETIAFTNRQFFQFEVTGFGEGLQFTEYTAPGDHYGWHTDSGVNQQVRKLSATTLLSDPDDFDGGDFEISVTGNDDDLETMERGQGRTVVFPSWTPHRVAPVTRGTRYSLVAWVTGPPFK